MDGKWITDLCPTTPLTEAARLVLSIRLDVVQNYLPLAIREHDNDVEHVHQLRVAARRASAALELFSPCIPTSKARKAKKVLRKIRRAAGEARDRDVFFLHLLDRRGKVDQSEHLPGIDYLLGLTRAQREQAQSPLLKLEAKTIQRFGKAQKKLLDSIRSSEAPLEAIARPQIERVLRDLQNALKEDLSDYDNLHGVRIIGKRLRYTMEVFVSCFEESFKNATYPKVEKVQKILGNANDSVGALEHLQQSRDALDRLPPQTVELFSPGLDALIGYHEQRLEKLRKNFQEWLSDWRGIEVISS